MNLTRLDIGAIATYIGGGGLAGVTLALDHFFPARATDFNSISLMLVSIAGIVRIVTNPTPTNNVQVYDRATDSIVSLKTVAPPSGVPAPPPTYSTAPKGT